MQLTRSLSNLFTLMPFLLNAGGLRRVTPAGAAEMPATRMNPRLLLCLPLLLFLFLTPVRAQDEVWKTYKEAAEKARSRKQYDEAEKLYKLAVSKEGGFGELDERRIQTLSGMVILYLEWEPQDKFAEAVPLYKQALAMLEKGAGADSVPAARAVLVMAGALVAKQKYVEAHPLYNHALTIFKKNTRFGHPDVINALNRLATNYGNLSKFEEQVRAMKEQLDILERSPEYGPEHLNTAYTLATIGLYLNQLGRYDEAETVLKRAAKTANNLDESKALIAQFHLALYLVYSRAWKYAEAEEQIKLSLFLNESVYGPKSVQVKDAARYLGEVLFSQGKYDEAELAFARALNIVETLSGPDSRDVLAVAENLASTYMKKLKYGEAEALYKRVLAIREKLPETDSGRSASATLLYLGDSYLKQKRYAEAHALHQRVMDALEKDGARGLQNYLGAMTNAGALFRLRGHHRAAQEVFEKAIERWEKSGSAETRAVADIFNLLGSTYLSQKKYQPALAAYQRGLSIFQKTATPHDQRVVFYYSNLGRAYYHLGKYVEGESFFLKALAVVEKKTDPSSLNDAALCNRGYALLLYAQGKDKQAEPLFQKALAVLADDVDFGDRDVSAGWHELAVLFTSQGKHADAEAAFRRAIEIREKGLGDEHPELAASLEEYASLLRKTNRAGEADALGRRAATIRANHSPF